MLILPVEWMYDGMCVSAGVCVCVCVCAMNFNKIEIRVNLQVFQQTLSKNKVFQISYKRFTRFPG